MQSLIEAVRNRNCILFVGAGVSMNLGLPGWRDLIDELAKSLDYSPDVFRTYGDFTVLAEFYRLKKGSIGPLRSYLDRMWHNPNISIGTSTIHKKIVELNCQIIYTTNYDRWLERALEHHKRKYTKIVNVNDFSNVNATDTQIVKFHGDFDDDSSIVLDESSYFRRLDFETPLDIKLRADTLGKSVLFIGYNVADINIRLLFWKLSKLWRQENLAHAQPQSYLFMATPNPIQEAVLQQWGIQTLSGEKDEPGEALETFLSQLVLDAGL